MKAAQQKQLRANFHQVVLKLEVLNAGQTSQKVRLNIARLQAEKESLLFQLKYSS